LLEPRLLTDRLELRPVKAKDLAWYAQLRARDGLDASAAAARLRDAVEHWKRHGFGKFAIFLDEEPAGLITLNHAGGGLVGIAAKEVDLGWYVFPHLWGRGIAPEAAAAVVRWAHDAGIEALVVYIRQGNPASTRVAQKLGLGREPDGRARDGDAIEVYRPRSMPHYT